MRAIRSVEITLAVSVGLMAAVGAATLTRAPPRVVRSVALEERVGREEHTPLLQTNGDTTACQSEEALPAEVTGVRVWLRSVFGAPVHLTISSGTQVLAAGSRGADWIGQSVTVPVAPLDHATANVRLCAAIGPNNEPVVLLGTSAPPAQGVTLSGNAPITPGFVKITGAQVGGRMGVEYLAPGHGSWWSRLGTVATHMGLGRSFSGTWIVLLVAVLMLAVGVLAVRLAAQELP